MSKGYILQVIGKLEGYEKVNFVIENRKNGKKREYEGRLSSDAVKEYYYQEEKTELEAIFLVPESLALNIEEEYNKYLGLNNREIFKKEVVRRLNESIENKVDDRNIIVLQSVGEYKRGNIKVDFDNHVDNIVSYLVLELNKILDLSKEEIKLFGDVSTGQNIYTASLIEALRILITRYKLRKLFQKEKKLTAKIVSHPPIVKDVSEISKRKKIDRKYRIQFYDYDVRVFFDLPLKNPDLNNISSTKFIDFEEEEKKIKELIKISESELKTNVGKKFEEEMKIIKELINNTVIAFNILKYNVPLALFNQSIVNLENDPEEGINCLEKILKYFENFYNPQNINECTEGYEYKIIYPKIKRDLFINTLLTLDLLTSLKQYWNEKISPVIKENNMISTKNIENIFPETYSNLNLNLNTIFLKIDLEKIENYACNLKEGEEKTLKELLAQITKKEKTECENKKYLSDQKRNFFAHSGLLSDFIKIKKEKDTIFISYIEDKLACIKSWLRNPEK